MIPKIIHYCWFGGKELPPLAKKCIASWQKFCPDYEIIRWDASNFPLAEHPYAAWCYANRQWAFLSDYVRLNVVADRGGVYLDTDVELVTGLDALRESPAFIGFENKSYVNSGQGFGGVAGHPAVLAMLEEYEKKTADESGAYELRACPQHNTQALVKLGLKLDGREQAVAGAKILPADWLNPYDPSTGELKRTANTVAIHWYSQSWISPLERLRTKIARPFHRIFGKDCFAWLRKAK